MQNSSYTSLRSLRVQWATDCFRLYSKAAYTCSIFSSVCAVLWWICCLLRLSHWTTHIMIHFPWWCSSTFIIITQILSELMLNNYKRPIVYHSLYTENGLHRFTKPKSISEQSSNSSPSDLLGENKLIICAFVQVQTFLLKFDNVNVQRHKL